MRLCVFDVALDARACLPVGMGLVVVWACVCCVRAETAKRLCACLLSGGLRRRALMLSCEQGEVLQCKVPAGGLEAAQEGVQAAGPGVRCREERIGGREDERGAVRGVAAGA